MRTSKEREINRQYVRDFLLSMVAYAIVLLASIWLINRMDASWMAWLVAAAPVIPIAFALRAFLRYLGQIDEFQQRMQLQAIGFSAGATAILTFTLGLLENVGFPQLSLIWVFPMIVAFWGIATVWLSRRAQ